MTASGPAAEVAKYEMGFVQTVFRSSRHFKYKRIGRQRKIGERVLPGLLGKNLAVEDTTGILPVKDGDDYTSGGNKALKLYYETTDTVDFGNSPASTKTTTLFDQPETSDDWERTHKGHQVHLVRTSGLDSFRTWLVIRKKSWSSTDYRRLGYIDWKVGYKSKVNWDAALTTPTLVPDGSSGGRASSPVKGVGVYLPVTGADSANSAAGNKESNW